MGKEHRLAERRQSILAALAQAGQLSVAELSLRFDVSEVTIRTDLAALNAQGLLLRTRGGALATHVLPELSFDIRQQQNAENKARIARTAAQLVRDGDTIALDASTTALAIIPHIEQLSELTVVTNSLKAALWLLRTPHIHVIVPGGHLRRDSISLVGRSQCDLLEDIHVRIGFFGARGITIDEGLTDVNLEEVRTKRRLIECCQQVVAVVDSRKWGQVAASTFADLDRIDRVITDVGAPKQIVQQLRLHGVDVVQV
ncbi:MAG: DeoR/GlpR family DNA-binding transcription regulator [Chloroflexota bacterium]|nr:DeoR/GlpR family DNA-binding transcription regulator [Chloroflexota bacterium]